MLLFSTTETERTVRTTRLQTLVSGSTLMSLGKHLVNGIVSVVISVGITAVTADEDPGPYDLTEMLLAVAVSSFLSGVFTSYFAE